MTGRVLGVITPCPCCDGDGVVEFSSLIFPAEPAVVRDCPVCLGGGRVADIAPGMSNAALTSFTGGAV